MSNERRAPVQAEDTWMIPRRRTGRDAPGTIAWEEHEEAWRVYAARYGTDQSAERVAARGGFGRDELRKYLGREPATFRSAS